MSNSLNTVDQNAFVEYLAKHGIYDYKIDQSKQEISFPCPFRHGCDDDHRGNEEYHCGFNCEKSTYNCFKCGEKGNFVTLKKFFGDYESGAAKPEKNSYAQRVSLTTRVRNAHLSTRDQVREYFHKRGINDASINRFMLGAWQYGGRQKYMIPVFNKDGEVAYIKLRRQDDRRAEEIAKSLGKEEEMEDKYVFYPAGANIIMVGEDELIKSSSSDVLICEGELDRIIAIQEGVKMPVVTAGGAQSFKNAYIKQLKSMRNIYVCMDNDDTGERAFKDLAKRISNILPNASVFRITLPFESDSHGDLTDYFVQKKGTADELFTKYSEYYCGAKPIDVSQFRELTTDDIAGILDSTIKYDYVSKVITFLAMLLTYTDSDQINVMFNASSSTGKSFICLETSKYFPEQDVKVYGKTTPTAFYYSRSLRKNDPETNEPYIDLERRIMVFTEQPDTQLQANLRSILSHDSKKVPFANTNKGRGNRNIADEGYLLGFPSAFFCSANMNIDEQEQTRCIILSPDSTKEKVMAGIDAYIDKSCHRAAFDARLQSDEERNSLKERVLYIKSLHVDTVNVGDSEYLKQRFLGELKGNVPPRAMREIAKVTSLAKAVALLNAPFRMKDGKITVTRKDIDEAVKLWGVICESMAHGLSPQVYDFYKRVILPAWLEKNAGQAIYKGVTYKELRAKYYAITGGFPNMENLRKQWIPMLEIAELIKCEQIKKEKGGEDGRATLITPMLLMGNDLEEKA